MGHGDEVRHEKAVVGGGEAAKGGLPATQLGQEATPLGRRHPRLLLVPGHHGRQVLVLHTRRPGPHNVNVGQTPPPPPNATARGVELLRVYA